MQTIHITGIESKVMSTGNQKIILICQEGKFYFFQKTKTGTSKAWDQYQKFGFKIGDAVQADVKSEQKEYNGHQYTDNWIKFFSEVEGNPAVGANTPVPTENASYAKPEANNDEIAALNARLDKASAAFVKLSDEVKSLRILVEEVAGKKATDLHVALPNRDIHETKTTSLEEAAKIVDSHKEIPIINELPKGFETL